MLVPLLALAAPKYRIVDLGLPPGAEKAEAVAINNRGEVAITAEVTVAVPWFNSEEDKGVSQVPVRHGYLWREGRFFDFGDPNPGGVVQADDVARTEPKALNDHGIVVGGKGPYGPVFMTGLEHAAPFIWRGRGLESLGVTNLGQANDINDLGDIVGDDGHGAFARLNGKIVALPEASHVEPRDPGGEMGDVNHASGVSINDRRQILMDSTYGGKRGDTDLSLRPFLVDGSRVPLRLRPVPLPKDFVEGRGVALNDRGTVLAFATRRGASDTTPFLVRDGRIVRLPFTGAMNNREEVVGGDPLAVWRVGHMTLLPSFPGWELQTATGINDRGAICGTGLHDGKTRAYVLLPR